MKIDDAHKIVLSYADAVGNDDWAQAIACIEASRVERAFNLIFAGDQTTTRATALYYFDEGRKHATN